MFAARQQRDGLLQSLTTRSIGKLTEVFEATSAETIPMDESAIPISDEDVSAARELLRLHPALVEGVQPAELERGLAELHHSWGDDRFRLVLGLREPVNEAEQCWRELWLGAITFAEARERLRAYAHRAVDAQMLRVFFSELGQQVHRYGRFMQEAGNLFLNPTRQPVRESDEAEIDRLASAIQEKSTLYKQEITSVFEFLQEARVAKQAGIVRLGEHSTPTAAEMVMLVTHYAQRSWTSNRELGRKSQTRPEYIRALSGSALFGRTTYSGLPRAQDVQTRLDEEYALARVYLRECRATRDDDGVVAVASPVTASHLLSIKHWSELAIGIDEQGRYWALVPAPEPGQPFKKSQAVELPLPGKRWNAVLNAFAASTTIETIRRGELIHAFGYLPPPIPTSRDRRAKPGAIESANIEGLEVRQLAAVKRLNTTLADLRRELGKLISVPSDRGSICLRSDEEVIRSGFRVRYLVRDESDRLTFGTRP